MNCPNCNSKRVILEGNGLFDSIYEAWLCEKCGYSFLAQASNITELDSAHDSIDRAEREYQGYRDLENYENYENYES